ncbi:MAG TPA: PfkB family carbohydrate kinase, partial [Gemmatimonadales bacterium]|nr:PfkB family carbohydrate kinase [Gemmatimonadales bacterium]
MDLVTFGEAMLRLSMTADSFKPYVGGSELNVAVLAARLGVQARWVSRLPDNALGKMIAARAAEQGVDTQVAWTPEG